jgi:hypothetical protein
MGGDLMLMGLRRKSVLTPALIPALVIAWLFAEITDERNLRMQKSDLSKK